ncbi:MAG: hypothetical protein AAFQ74_02515 [Cyanobacteria bacterium J06623_4]
MILTGLRDLATGETRTVGALLIVIASTRLANAGLKFPTKGLTPEPELTLYSQLENTRDDAYPYYNALLDSLNSFCNALERCQKQTKR